MAAGFKGLNAGKLRETARALWAALPERGWPVAQAWEWLRNAPRLFVAVTCVFAALIVARALYLIGFGSAEEVNRFMVGVAAFLGAPFLIWRTWIADRQRHVSQEELYTGLLVKAVEQLGATREEKTEDGKTKTVPNTEVRVGAIYALEKLARDYLPLHWQIMEILCAYVRKNAGPPKPCLEEERAIYAKAEEERTDAERAALERRKTELKPPFVDVQTALTVIGRRSEKQRKFEKDARKGDRLDLGNCHLAAVELAGLHFEGASFGGACLEGARLAGALLEGALLLYAHLEGAWLHWAHLEGASLLYAHLEGAVLLSEHLEGASLPRAHLEGAWLLNAHLEGAHLRHAHLEGSLLYEARGLTQPQLNSAHGDEHTTLPEGLVRPAHWTKGGAGEGEGAAEKPGA